MAGAPPEEIQSRPAPEWAAPTPRARLRFAPRRSSRTWSTRVSITVGALTATGLLLRLALSLRSLPFLDRVFVPDDTYYFLSIARSLAHGHGPRADAVHLTNGFQPLLAFVLTPVFWVVHSPDGGLRSALVLLAICDGLTTLLLARLVPSASASISLVNRAGVRSSSPS